MKPTAHEMDLMAWYGVSLDGCEKSRRVVFLKPLVGGVFGGLFVGRNHPAVGRCDMTDSCRDDCSKICVHAEADALARAGRWAEGSEVFHLKVVDGKPVTSGEPSCVECSKLMLQARVAGVWLYQEAGWKRWTAKDFHEATVEHLCLYRSEAPAK